MPLENLNTRFAKYFLQILLKMTSLRDIMTHVSYEQVYALTYQLLTRLLVEGLDKIGDNKEGEIILKTLNNSMLKLLENCNHTYIICSLINLQTQSHQQIETKPKLA